MPLRIRLTGISAAMDEVAGKINTITRLAMIGADRRLVQRTPVDTGRARNNWLPSVGTPRLDTLEADGRNPGPKFASATFEDPPPTKGRIYWLSNNLDYIEGLNQNKSDQAPAGYVETAVQEAVARANRVRL